MSDGFTIEPLTNQDRSRFTCGNEALDRYLTDRAGQDIKRRVASCFLLVDNVADRIAGYYTLAATSIPSFYQPASILRKLPRYPLIPGALIGRLAIDQQYQGRSLGGVLIADAALRIINGDLRAFAIVVEAKNAQAVAFYEAKGFIPFQSREMALFLPLATFIKANDSA